MGFKKITTGDSKKSITLLNSITENMPILIDKAMRVACEDIDNEDPKIQSNAIKIFNKLVDKVVPTVSVNVQKNENGEVNADFANQLLDALKSRNNIGEAKVVDGELNE